MYIKENHLFKDRGSDYDETLQNLTDFLQYLEDKKIINCKTLENKHEMNNLINDLMKLDLCKFNSKAAAQEEVSAKVNSNFGKGRRNSAECAPQAQEGKPNIYYYYSPVNVNYSNVVQPSNFNCS